MLSLKDAVFYNYFRSSAAYRMRIVMALKGLIPRETVDVDLRTGAQRGEDYLRIAPSGLVPSLDFGNHPHGQSLALIEWIDATYPEPKLVPADPHAALAAREIAFSIACDIHPVNNLRVLNRLTEQFGANNDARTTWYHHWLELGFDAVETLLKRHRDHGGEGPFALGDAVSIADICLIPQVYNAERFKFDLTPYPLIRAINDHCLSLPAFSDTSPDAG